MLNGLKRLIALSNVPAAWVFLLALLSGLAYILFQPQAIVTDDALGYLRVADVLQAQGLAGLDNVMKLDLLRAPWYILSVTGLRILFDGFDRETILVAIRVMQVVWYALSTVLVYGIAGCFWPQRRPKLIAAALMLLYPPFVFHTGRLLVETQTMLFLSAFVFLWLRQRPFWAGLFLFLALSDSFLSIWMKALVFVGLLGAEVLWGFSNAGKQSVIQLWQQRLRPLLKTLAVFGVGFVILHLISIWYVPKEGLSPFSLAHFTDTDGWAALVRTNGELSLAAATQQTLPAFLQHQTGEIGVTLQWILSDPGQFLRQYFTNIWRFFALPDNVHWRSWLGFSPDVLNLWHQALVWLAVVGAVNLSRDKRWRLVYLFPLIWALSYSTHNIELRYNLPVMPFVLLGAVGGIEALLEALAQQKPEKCWRVAVVFVLATGLLSAWLLGVLFPFIKLILPDMLPMQYRLLGVFACFGGGIWLMKTLFETQVSENTSAKMSEKNSLVAAMCVMLLAITPVTSAMIVSPRITDWSVELAGHQAYRRLSISEAALQNLNWDTFLVVDTWPVMNLPGQTLMVTINGYPVSSFTWPPYIFQRLKYMQAGLLEPADFSQYRFIPLSDEIVNSLRQRKSADILLWQEGNGPSIRLFGDYFANRIETDHGAVDMTVIPNPDWGTYSMYKQIFDRDGRIPLTTPAIQGSESRLFTDTPAFYRASKPGEDLSPSLGLQTGQFRVFLFRMDKVSARQPYGPFPQFYTMTTPENGMVIVKQTELLY